VCFDYPLIVSPSSSCDVDLLRMTLAVVVQRELDFDTAAADAAAGASVAAAVGVASNNPFSPSRADMELMVSHQEQVPAELEAQGQAMARHMLERMPASTRTNIADIMRIAAVINANSHSLCRQDEPSKIWGVGLYPLCSMFNHSCFPNMQYCSMGSDLCYRLLRDVAPGEELTVNYSALYAPAI
jgi:hypothetical protein